MAQTDNTANIAFSSAFPTDKIVEVYEGSFAAAAATTVSGLWKRHDIPHSFGRPLFTKLLWSLDNSSFNDGGATNDSGYVISYSDSDNVYVFTTILTGTIYYKIAGFWIDNYDATNPSVEINANDSSSVWFDSRLNYQKIALQGEYTHPAGNSNTEVISHNLGYRPNVRVYVETLPGEVWQAQFGGASYPWAYTTNMVEASIQIGDNDITIDTYAYVGTPDSRVWYIIYYDGDQ